MAEEVKENESAPEMIEVEKVNHFLKILGLVTPIDYLFLDHAMNMHREAITKNSNVPFQFLFQLVVGKQETDLNFPFSSFLEKVIFRYTDPSSNSLEFKETERFIVTNLVPSDHWKDLEPRAFSDFHLYYLDVLKPMTKQSAEELYALFDTKRDETFFLVLGDRKVDLFLVVLFVHKGIITTFHIPPHENKLTDVGHICKWIDCQIPTFQRQISEYGSFKLPDRNLVLTEEGVKMRKQQWQEAFGNPDMIDTPDAPDLPVTELMETEVCENCSS